VASWSRHLDPAINTPDGKTLRTLKDAAEYVVALPEKVQAEPAWQLAAQELKNAAELAAPPGNIVRRPFYQLLATFI
jgi:hypothetical protein